MLIRGWEARTNSTKIEQPRNLMLPQYFNINEINIIIKVPHEISYFNSIIHVIVRPPPPAPQMFYMEIGSLMNHPKSKAKTTSFQAIFPLVIVVGGMSRLLATEGVV